MSLSILFNDSPFFLINGEQNYSSSPFEFDAINLGGSSTFVPSTVQYYDGARSYCAYFDGSAIANGYKSFTAQNEIYIKSYIRLNSDVTINSAWGAQTLLRLMQGQWNPILRLAIGGNSSGTPYRWYITGNGITDTYSTEEVTLGSWLKIEFYWKYGADGTSVFYIKINDTTIAESNGYTCAYSDVTRFYVGGTDEFSRFTNGSMVYYDNIRGYLKAPSESTDYFVTISNSIGITDTLSKIFNAIIILQNNISITDTLNNLRIKFVYIYDNINITDNVSSFFEKVKIVIINLYTNLIKNKNIDNLVIKFSKNINVVITKILNKW